MECPEKELAAIKSWFSHDLQRSERRLDENRYDWVVGQLRHEVEGDLIRAPH
jgi:hypothetical protein